jgi:hypothetical protein
MQIQIVSGVCVKDGEYRTTYPRNYVPVPKEQGISSGYLRPADGIVEQGTGPGVGRGGYNWKGVCYRVMGTKLVSIDAIGAVRTLGDVGGSGQVTFDCSFDYLSISSGGKLFIYNGTLAQVTDADLGNVADHLWIDGYFMTTDGTSLVVTELGDPFSVNPLKYGSSEADPDPILGLLKLRNEVYALNRYTIEVFDNNGGELFPFSRVEGAQIQRGVIGTYAAAVFLESIAFVGGGRNESPAVWIGNNSQTTNISTREIEEILQGYTEEQLSAIVLEVKVDKAHKHLLMHLPNTCWVYDGAASSELKRPVWFELNSAVVGGATYRAKNLVWCYDKWLCEDPTTNQIGYLSDTVRTHYGDKTGWEFGTQILYNESRGAQFHELELVALPGKTMLGDDPVIWTSYSLDGETWSQERSIKAGKTGERTKRLRWLGQGCMSNTRIQKFRGTSDAQPCVSRLEAQLEPLNV